jgi:acyl transferase domain-containing protein
VGVFAAVFGPTRMLQLASLRVHFDDVAEALRSRAPESTEIAAFLIELSASLDEALPTTNTDTQPGGMPNLISARIANYFDFQGPNLALDGGEASLLKAFDAAVAFLEAGSLEMVLVVSVTGNTLPGWTGSVGPLLTGAGGGHIDEEASLFAVSRESIARRAGLPILAYVETTGLDTAHPAKASA